MKKSLLLTFVMLLSSVCLMAQNLKGGLTNVTTLKKPGAITRALTDKYPWGYYEGWGRPIRRRHSGWTCTETGNTSVYIC